MNRQEKNTRQLAFYATSKNKNMIADDMEILRCIGTTIDEDNYPAPENVPAQKQQHQGREKKCGKLCK